MDWIRHTKLNYIGQNRESRAYSHMLYKWGNPHLLTVPSTLPAVPNTGDQLM